MIDASQVSFKKIPPLGDIATNNICQSIRTFWRRRSGTWRTSLSFVICELTATEVVYQM